MKRILEENINTEEYWNELLEGGEWGKEREGLYSKIADYLPKEEVTVLDVGCAVGHGTIALKEELPKAKVEGCDFSDKGIKKAKEMYGDRLNFFVHDIRTDELPNKYDFILLIEVLEHLDQPKKAVEKYLRYARKNLLVTVPYKHEGWKEHMYKFNTTSFDDFEELEDYKIIKKPSTGERLILFIFKSG